eukprot:6429641-Amphidinium_carterae.1
MIKEQVEDEEEVAQDYPANVAVFPMMDDGEERGSTSRTPRVPGSSRNSPHPPSFSVMLAKMENRKKLIGVMFMRSRFIFGNSD